MYPAEQFKRLYQLYRQWPFVAVYCVLAGGTLVLVGLLMLAQYGLGPPMSLVALAIAIGGGSGCFWLARLAWKFSRD